LIWCSDSSPELYSTGPTDSPCSRSLQQQRRLADAGLAAEQDQRAGHDTAAEDAIELVDPVVSRECCSSSMSA